MKLRTSLLMLLALSVLAVACGNAEADDSANGQPVTVLDVEFMYLESYPVQVRATVNGEMPTPCHELRTTIEPVDDQGRVVVTMLAEQADDQICAQVIHPFETTIDLGSFETGDYVLVINGEEFEFTV